MNHQVDARGLACPLPVVHTKEEVARMQPGEQVLVLVDNEIAVQNLEKFARVRGHGFSAEKRAEREFAVTITKSGNADQPAAPAQSEQAAPETVSCGCGEGLVVAISSNQMGSGAPELGETLMKAFIFALTKQDQLPATVILYNSGAFLSCEGSDSLADLRELEARGVTIMTCGTCLNYYGITDKLAVGGVSNMYDIVEKLERASIVVRP